MTNHISVAILFDTDGRSNHSPIANRGCDPTSTSPAATRTDAVETTCDPDTVTSESMSNVDAHSGYSTKITTSLKYPGGILGVDYSSSSEDEST